MLVALTRLAVSKDRPFLLVFDQVDNLDEEQAAAASPLTAMTEAARSVRLDFIRLTLYFDCFYRINGHAGIHGHLSAGVRPSPRRASPAISP